MYLRTDNSTGAVEWGTDGITFAPFSESFTDKSAANFYLTLTNTSGVVAFALQNPLVIGDFSLPGVDTSFAALQIDVLAGATISTAVPVGDSGDLRFEAPQLTTGAGTSLITDDAGSSDTPGDLTIVARGTLSTLSSIFGGTLPVAPSVSTTQAQVTLTDTTIRAGNVSIEATSDSADKYDDQDETNDNKSGAQTAEGISDFIGSVSLYVGFAISQADANVTINGGSIESSQLSVASTALSQAQTTVLSNKVGAAGLVISEPSAVINVQNGAVIQSLGDISLNSNAQSAASVNSLLRSKEKGGTISLGFTDLTSQAIVSADSTITTGGSFTAQSDASKQMVVRGTATGLQGAKATIAVNYSQSLTDVTSAIDGQVTAAGDVHVDSQLTTAANNVVSYSQTGFGGVLTAVRQQGSECEYLTRQGQELRRQSHRSRYQEKFR